MPYSDTSVEFFATDFASFFLNSNRVTAYWQYNLVVDIDSAELGITGGIRGNYWDFNHQFLASPRLSVSLRPNCKKDVVFFISSGLYHQPPFFKEMRKLDGNMNPDIKAQSSVHLVLGSDFQFTAWNRPFKLVTELYYKY
ncbi:MAG: TonB-dependent receptor, partial [Candidatus Moranbacteria bacterium]|nr:TonB-dependent receptor [Candidatus Moranbacteria bacterium]